ncbi:dihydrofolate reductase family protein [Nocardia panacis]|uniref:dihydrofolate reductase family protein n=1 Tax=Nocardia panacis TaxID=2340916 RepID=UPI001EF11435|nr:dihydrofolate reductase family protein [Nocardia panacis]
MAKKIGDARKYVVSHQNLEFTWRNSELLRGELIEAVAELKSRTGGDIAVSGSVSVVRQLLAAGLIDELHLLVHPVVLNKGDRLFGAGERIPLRLLSATAFESGVVHLVYGPDATPPSGGYAQAREHLPQ